MDDTIGQALKSKTGLDKAQERLKRGTAVLTDGADRASDRLQAYSPFIHLLQTRPELWVAMAQHNSRRRPYLSELLDVTFNRGSNAREMALRVRVYCALLVAAGQASIPSVPASPAELLSVWYDSFQQHPLQSFVARRLLENDAAQDDFARESLVASVQLWLKTGKAEPAAPEVTASAMAASLEGSAAQTGRRTTMVAGKRPTLSLGAKRGAAPAAESETESEDDQQGADEDGDDGFGFEAPLKKSRAKAAVPRSRPSLWSKDDVLAWLAVSHHVRYQTYFRQAAVDGAQLAAMSEAQLIQIGLSRRRARRIVQDVAAMESDPARGEPLSAPFYGKQPQVRRWSAADVADWLRASGRESMTEVFTENGVDGSALLDLDSELLAELGLRDARTVSSLMTDVLLLRDIVSTYEAASQAVPKSASAPEVTLALEVARLAHGAWRRLPYALGLLLRSLNAFLSTTFPKLAHGQVESTLTQFFVKEYLAPLLKQTVAAEAAAAEETLGKAGVESRRIWAERAATLLVHAAQEDVVTPKDATPELQRQYQRFFTQASPQLKAAVRKMLKVASLEDHFGLDDYGDAGALSQPMIYVAPGDLLNLHQMLVRVWLGREETGVRRVGLFGLAFSFFSFFFFSSFFLLVLLFSFRQDVGSTPARRFLVASLRLHTNPSSRLQRWIRSRLTLPGLARMSSARLPSSTDCGSGTSRSQPRLRAPLHANGQAAVRRPRPRAVSSGKALDWACSSDAASSRRQRAWPTGRWRTCCSG